MLDAVGKAGNVPYRPGTRCCNKCAENVDRDQEEKFTTHAEYKPKKAQFRSWVVHNFSVNSSRCACKDHRDKIKVPDAVVKEQ